ncbi:FtsX-like permease family protein, partial [Rubrivirga sp.]|uniref:ABC transporter permease n=1 Tax=Rubrivirga sp. TaxID=1885344 RepID=UPI003C75D5BC
MLTHHLRLALRTLRRDRAYALLNGVGLAVAFTCCLLIGLFMRAELSFDRFHDRANEVVIIASENQWGHETHTGTSTPYPLHVALEDGVPSVQRAVLTSQGAGPREIARPGGAAAEGRVLTATDGFFEVFSFPVLEGDAETALREPGSVVLTEGLARQLFGEANAVGQTLEAEVNDEPGTLTVTGVTTDPPRTSTVTFDAVLSAQTLPETRRSLDSWGASMWRTHARLVPSATVADLDAQLVGVSQTHFPDSDSPTRYFGTALPDFYMSDLNHAAGFRGDPAYLGLFGASALFILLLGGINYVNLATARATRRAREVGVRKAVGAGRWGVAAQFLTESVVLTLVSALVAVGLAAIVLTPFNDAFGSDLLLADLGGGFVLAVVMAATVVGLVAGAYPALFLSGFRPAHVLRGALSSTGRPSGSGLRRVLVVTQFVVAIGLLAGTGVVLRQIAFTTESDLGFVKDGLVWLPATEGLSYGGEREATPWQAMRDAALAVPGVSVAVGADATPGQMSFVYSLPADPSRPEESFSFTVVSANPGYADALGAELVAGSDLEDDRPSALLNEASAELLGWTPEEAVGKALQIEEEMVVAGVVGDYAYESMRNAIGPIVIHTATTEDGAARQYQGILTRVEPGQMGPALEGLEAAWAEIQPDLPFEPQFVDENIAGLYDADRRLSRVLGGFALVAVLVACLGLVGLAAYTAERRRKEIGVRRVLGATVRQVVVLLTREYAGLVVIGAAIAVPLTVVGVQRWLDGFAYRVALGPGLFVGVVAVTFAVA